MVLFQKFNNILSGRNGASLVELLMAIGLAVIIFPALLTGFFATRGGRAQQDQRLQAMHLAREATEAVRLIHDSAMHQGTWSNFASNGTYHIAVSGSSWVLQPQAETTSDGFTQSILISDVYRNGQQEIVASGGVLDPSTKRVDVKVCWGASCLSSVDHTLFLTRYENSSRSETTQAEFEAGTYSNTIVITNNSGGEVILGQGGGRGDWCKPNLTINALDLPGQGITTAISARYANAYTTTGGNSSGNSMDSILISDPPLGDPVASNNPPSYNNRKTYGIYADEKYVYLTSDHPGLTVDIITNTQPFTQVGTFDVKGRGISVFAVGNVGYVTAGNYLYTFDIASILGGNHKATQLGSIALAGQGNRVVVVGQYAYVATSNTSNQLQIIDVSNPRNMSVQANINLNNGEPGVDVSVDEFGTTAYIITEKTVVGDEFFVVNLSSQSVTKSYNTGDTDPKEVALVPGGWGIVVGSGGIQYQVFRVSDSATTPCGSISNPHGSSSVNAVDFIQEPDGDVYSYILTDDSRKEFQIIAGGGGGGVGGQYTPSGIFESQTINLGNDVALNNFSATTQIPSSTSISFKLSLKHAASGSCSGVTFTEADFVPFVPGQLPLYTMGSGYINPGQCLRYRAYLSTTDLSQTPTLFDITFNYSL